MATVLISDMSFDTTFFELFGLAIIFILHMVHAVSLTETYTVQQETLTVTAVVEAQNQIMTCRQVCQVLAASAVSQSRHVDTIFVATQVGLPASKLVASLSGMPAKQCTGCTGCEDRTIFDVHHACCMSLPSSV